MFDGCKLKLGIKIIKTNETQQETTSIGRTTTRTTITKSIILSLYEFSTLLLLDQCILLVFHQNTIIHIDYPSKENR